ncbi:hypothetical protein EJB05_33496, partial [Eragrostis curvula]
MCYSLTNVKVTPEPSRFLVQISFQALNLLALGTMSAITCMQLWLPPPRS